MVYCCVLAVKCPTVIIQMNEVIYAMALWFQCFVQILFLPIFLECSHIRNVPIVCIKSVFVGNQY